MRKHKGWFAPIKNQLYLSFSPTLKGHAFQILLIVISTSFVKINVTALYVNIVETLERSMKGQITRDEIYASSFKDASCMLGSAFVNFALFSERVALCFLSFLGGYIHITTRIYQC